MTPSFATSLDALGGWRAALGERVDAGERLADAVRAAGVTLQPLADTSAG